MQSFLQQFDIPLRQKIEEIFLKESITGDLLSELNENYLKDMGFQIGERIKISKYLQGNNILDDFTMNYINDYAPENLKELLKSKFQINSISKHNLSSIDSTILKKWEFNIGDSIKINKSITTFLQSKSSII